ncbi:MAG: DMT family transporter [Candidatus Binatia bacterium]
MSASNLSDRLAVFGSAVLFSTGGVAIKWLAFGAWQVAAMRALFAVIAVWWLVPGPVVMRRGAVMLTGAAQGSSMLLFVLANKSTTAANAIFLQSAAPLYIPLLASTFLGERTTKRDLAAMAGIAVGLSFFFVGAQEPSVTAPNPRLGDLLAIASGLAWACTVVGLRYLARENPTAVNAAGEIPAAEQDDVLAAQEELQFPNDARVLSGNAATAGAAKGALLWGNLFVVAVALPMALPLPAADASDWGILVYLGVAQVALAYRLLVRAVARVPALEASLLALFEPVLNPVWAFALLGETPSSWALVGAGILATVTIVRAAAGSRRDA